MQEKPSDIGRTSLPPQTVTLEPEFQDLTEASVRLL